VCTFGTPVGGVLFSIVRVRVRVRVRVTLLDR